MERTQRTDLKHQNTFVKFGDTFTKIWGDDKKHIYVYKRTKQFGEKTIVAYEVIKGVKYTNPDGKQVYVYPSSEQFGNQGYYISGDTEYAHQRIEMRKQQFLLDRE